MNKDVIITISALGVKLYFDAIYGNNNLLHYTAIFLCISNKYLANIKANTVSIISNLCIVIESGINVCVWLHYLEIERRMRILIPKSDYFFPAGEDLYRIITLGIGFVFTNQIILETATLLYCFSVDNSSIYRSNLLSIKTLRNGIIASFLQLSKMAPESVLGYYIIPLIECAVFCKMMMIHPLVRQNPEIICTTALFLSIINPFDIKQFNSISYVAWVAGGFLHGLFRYNLSDNKISFLEYMMGSITDNICSRSFSHFYKENLSFLPHDLKITCFVISAFMRQQINQRGVKELAKFIDNDVVKRS